MRRLEAPSLSDHACAGYATDTERVRLFVGWFVSGLELGQRCLYVGDGSSEELFAELPSIVAIDGAVQSGALLVAPTSDVYLLDQPIDPPKQLATYSGAVDEARAAGFVGLRVVADITRLVADPGMRAAHLRWEQYADRYMSEHPLSALCIYDRRRVDRVDAIMCSHPIHGAGDQPFSVYAVGSRAAALAGELDASMREIAAEVLGALPEGDEVLDLAELSFIDSGSAAMLRNALLGRRDCGRPLHVVGAVRLVRRVWDACGFDPSLLTAA